MTGIAERKAQWEQQARDDERKAIVEFMKEKDKAYGGGITHAVLGPITSQIERGEHRKASKNEQVGGRE